MQLHEGIKERTNNNMSEPVLFEMFNYMAFENTVGDPLKRPFFSPQFFVCWFTPVINYLFFHCFQIRAKYPY